MGELTFYFDRCFGKRLPLVVESAKPPFVVKSHFGERFSDKTPDDEWLRIVGAKGWVVLSFDSRFHLESAALSAIEQFSIGCFYLWGGQLPTWFQLSVLTRAYPILADRIGARKRPFIFKVGSHGRLSRVKVWDTKFPSKGHVAAE